MNSSTSHLLFRRTMETDAASFAAQINSAASVQEQMLMNILGKNRDSEFGTQHDFSRIGNFSEYQKAVPLSLYEDYLPYIEAIHDGRSKVLVSEAILRLHLSSGTSSPSKYIPFTASLAREFQAAIAPWLISMYKAHPKISEGRAYWALTPPLATKTRLNSALPIGFDSEESYFTPEAQKILPALLINTGNSSAVESPTYFYQILLHLVENEDLTWLSVWSPTYLMVLWENFLALGECLLEELCSRRLRGSHVTSQRTLRIVQRVTKALADNRLDVLWPNLQLLSCWTDAWAAGFVDDIRRLFPDISIERKGLMATEGIVTIPWYNSGENLSPILAYRSHVFEFLDTNSLQPYLPHELEPGMEYEIVITTSGGYYRYRLGDIVRCEGFEGSVPRLSFQGRAGSISDLCGEKLNEYHVQRVLKGLLQEFSLEARYYVLAPDLESRRYTLSIEPSSRATLEILKKRYDDLLNALDARLKENVHYDYCRTIGQLRRPDFTLLGEGFRSRLIQAKSKTARLGVLKTSSFELCGNIKVDLFNEVRGSSKYEN